MPLVHFPPPRWQLLACLVTAGLLSCCGRAGVSAEIRKYESKRLVLYSDVEPARARSLPGILDQAFEVWEAYYGKHPDDKPGRQFRITGCVMVEPEGFEEAGLLPPEIKKFLEGIHPGKHEGRRFWMRNPETDYYREHLMVHEATHCFMTSRGGPPLPVWYLEGTAELFATHQRDPQRKKMRFAVMPGDSREFPGWGRLMLVRRDFRRGRLPRFDQLENLWKTEHKRTETYAWTWAFVKFLDAHPSYQERFRKLGRHLSDGRFNAEFERAFRPQWQALQFEWQLLARDLVAGTDFKRVAIRFHRSQPLPADGRSSVVAADRGWQSTGVRLRAGQAYQLTATGRFTLADKPRPWVSEPDGVSIRYHAGLPLGRLVCVLQPEDASITGLPRVVSVGSRSRIKPKVAGTLYLRLNDYLSELADNTGAVTVKIQPVAR